MIALKEPQLDGTLEHIEVNGARLAYRQRGDGEPVVFVHGGISDLTIWDPIFEPIAERYRAIAFSRRYAWPNAPVPDDALDSIRIHANDLATLIETMHLGPAHLVGNSWGGFICLVVARDHPQLVRSLVVQEPPVVPLFLGAPPRPTALLKTLITRPRQGRALARMVLKGMLPVAAALKRGDVDGTMETFVRRVALGDAGYDELPDWVKQHMRLNIGTHISQFRNNGGFVRFTPKDAQSIATPTLVMTGDQSPDAMRVLAHELARLLPNAHETEIASASHIMHVAAPHDTASAILRFLADQ